MDSTHGSETEEYQSNAENQGRDTERDSKSQGRGEGVGDVGRTSARAGETKDDRGKGGGSRLLSRRWGAALKNIIARRS